MTQPSNSINKLQVEENQSIWREYYQQAISRSHSKRTEFVHQLSKSNEGVAIDCGCGTGSDIDYLSAVGYKVYGFDPNPDAIEICVQRFAERPQVSIQQARFENFQYPQANIVLANSSLFFADSEQFNITWLRLTESILPGGVFAGDFLGSRDTWATNYRSPTTSFERASVEQLFEGFDIIRFNERDEQAPTARGFLKHWHVFSVVAIKRS